ncbi:MAG: efflux RND transporter periplasmic adaptor subunit [Anaerolineaceae bacterium]|nr:efflux RND transporter periplasmic adaptor subunit [Anaerolineaceae bacterium]
MQKLHRKLTLIGLAMIGILCGCSGQKTTEVQEIRTLPATIGSAHSTVTFIGNVTGGQSAVLTWKTSGVIETVNVKIGDMVAEGQVLATLEDETLPAAVISSEIPYISALDDLEEVVTSETPKAQAYSDLKEKEAALIEAEKYQEGLKYPHAVIGDIKYWSEQVDYYRGVYEEALNSLNDAISWRNSPNKSERNLYEDRRKIMLSALNKYAETYNNYLYYSGHATENQFEQAAADIDVAQAEYEKALKYFLTYENYPREQDIAKAQLKLDNAQSTYNRRNIISTINGVVTEITARPGDYVTLNTSAFRLDNTSRLYIPMDISEIDITKIHDGMKAEIVFDANKDKVYEGVVTTVSAYGTTAGSRVTFQTLVEILEPDDLVKIGMTAEVNMVIAEVENVLLVPANAVFTDNGSSYVAVKRGNSTSDIPVTVGLITDTVAEITGGYLREGDEVVVPSVDSSILKAMGLNDEQSGMK